MKYYYEAGRLDKKWIELYCRGDWENCTRYRMETKGKYHTDWMLPATDKTIIYKKNDGKLIIIFYIVNYAGFEHLVPIRVKDFCPGASGHCF